MTPGERNCWRSLDQKELRNPNLLKQFKDIKSSKKKKKILLASSQGQLGRREIDVCYC